MNFVDLKQTSVKVVVKNTADKFKSSFFKTRHSLSFLTALRNDFFKKEKFEIFFFLKNKEDFLWNNLMSR